ncbi:hypothetical protein BV379_19655 [Rhodovulum sulfidophilum]|nr:hypothetical protein BV379_19655 [Rhodovulum sulfidophilum]
MGSLLRQLCKILRGLARPDLRIHGIRRCRTIFAPFARDLLRGDDVDQPVREDTNRKSFPGASSQHIGNISFTIDEGSSCHEAKTRAAKVMEVARELAGHVRDWLDRAADRIFDRLEPARFAGPEQSELALAGGREVEEHHDAQEQTRQQGIEKEGASIANRDGVHGHSL